MEREIWEDSRARPGLRMDLEEIFMEEEEEEEKRDVKQMKSSLEPVAVVEVVLLVLVVRKGRSESMKMEILTSDQQRPLEELWEIDFLLGNSMIEH